MNTELNHLLKRAAQGRLSRRQCVGRAGVEFHNRKTLTADDEIATIKRHRDEKSQSGALGTVQGITEKSVSGDMVTLELASGNADLP